MSKAEKSTTENTAVSTQDSQRQAEKASGGEITNGTVKAAESGNNEAEKETFIYIGPTIRAGALKTNAMMIGTKDEVKNYLGDILEDIPQAERLLVTADRLADSKKRVKEKGTLLNKYYNEVSSLDHEKRRNK